MHGTDIAGGRGHWNVAAAECFFDTKTSAMNRHEFFPDLHSSSFKQVRFNIGFTPGTIAKRAATATHQRLTMRPHRSPKINATGQNRAEVATW
jgi:hypothetical protein